MYLFGFPEGLAGGSKETTYTTVWDTSHSTNYAYTNWNSTWDTSKTTSQDTTKSRPIYTHRYDGDFLFYANHNYDDVAKYGPLFFCKVDWTGQVDLNFSYWELNSGDCPPIGSSFTSVNDGRFRRGRVFGFKKPYGAGTVYNPALTSRTLILPLEGYEASINTGLVFHTPSAPTNYPTSSPKPCFRVELGNLRKTSTRDGIIAFWWYEVKIIESLNLDGNHPNGGGRKSFSSGLPTGSENYTGSTSWSTFSHNTSAPTSLSTTHGTTYQTNQLTSHITYG